MPNLMVVTAYQSLFARYFLDIYLLLRYMGYFYRLL